MSIEVTPALLDAVAKHLSDKIYADMAFRNGVAEIRRLAAANIVERMMMRSEPGVHNDVRTLAAQRLADEAKTHPEFQKLLQKAVAGAMAGSLGPLVSQYTRRLAAKLMEDEPVAPTPPAAPTPGPAHPELLEAAQALLDGLAAGDDVARTARALAAALDNVQAARPPKRLTYTRQ